MYMTRKGGGARGGGYRRARANAPLGSLCNTVEKNIGWIPAPTDRPTDRPTDPTPIDTRGYVRKMMHVCGKTHAFARARGSPERVFVAFATAIMTASIDRDHVS